ncbi:MAG: TetR/AcrR family transcriptional regulator [Microbacteriaceae bacterium]|nr:MAG: TetR/AcrR family transcriptional regulator [Microbacteriaceae bacterium]
MTDTPTEPELPRAVALAWGVAAHPQRGPKRELSIERIVDVAVELADRGGLGAVSMAAVASELGYTPMSLYRYVTSKDDLLVLMQEHGIGVPPESVREADGWRDGMRDWAAATLSTYREHPWLLDLAIEGTPQTPNNLAWLDAALETLAEAPADYEAKVSIVLAVMAQVRWQGVVERGYLAAAAAASVRPEDLDRQASDVIATFITPEQFPEVHRALQAGVFGPGPDDPFAFGLERVLDGIESYLATEPSARPATPLGDPEEEQIARDPKVKEAVKARREAEKQLREARKRERERMREARERMRRG